MADLTVDGVLKNYQDGMSSGATKDAYIAGVKATTVNPMQRAAEAGEAYLRGVERAERSGKRARRLLAVPKDRWVQNTITEGANRLSSGAKKAQEKQRRALQVMVPAWNAIRAEAATMPGGSEDEQLEKVRMSMRRQKEASAQL